MRRPEASIVTILLCLVLPLSSVPAGADETPEAPEQQEDQGTTTAEEEVALPEEATPMLTEQDLPKRAAPLLELGAPILDSGKLKPGIELPTGAVWRPALWVFGTYRTSVNYRDSNAEAEEILEWPHRLDLFANLQLSGTERLLVGVQPLHQDGRFTTYTASPEALEGWESEANFTATTAFFEGDLGELFPRLDPEDRKGLDIGFSIGRQLIEFQDGIMFSDQIDSIGITRNSMSLPGVSNLRTTLLIGWNDLHRDDNVEDEDAILWGLFSELDTHASTVEIDLAYITSTLEAGSSGDGLYWGVGSTQRIGFFNSTFRVNGSHALDVESAAVSNGVLLFAELSRELPPSHNIVYCNAFWGIDSYSSAARDPTAGGPLGRVGLLFAARGLGRFPPALGNRADDSWGAALGYQAFWDGDKTQLVLELGGRRSTVDHSYAVAAGARVQRKLSRRSLLQLDGYVTEPDDGPSVVGLRTELLVRF